MNPTTVMCIAAVMAAMLVSTSLALPPDFFRAGRGYPIPLHKKAAESGLDTLEVVCAYCGAFSPQLELECKRDFGEARKVCTVTLLNQIQEFSQDKGWQSQGGQQ